MPEGLTDVALASGPFNFRGTAYDGMVVNRAAGTAQIKLVGANNGNGGYQFMVWMTSGHPDTIHLRI